MMRQAAIIGSVSLILGCSMEGSTPDTDLSKINLPPGFVISMYAENIENARSMSLSDSGVLFVGTRRKGTVYAIVDSDGDGTADQTYVIDSGLNMPNGVAFRDGDLFVAEVSRILRYDDIESRLSDPPEPVVVYDEFPSESQHGWKYIAFGPDGMLYVPVGAPCNICDRGLPYASIWRLNVDGSSAAVTAAVTSSVTAEVYAEGVRNSVGLAWHPESGDLWFTDNGRDLMGDDTPSDELNHAPRPGMHFGYPFFHAGLIEDPEFGAGHETSDFSLPAQRLGPHVASLGLEFYQGNQFPQEYRGQIFIAEHGSWNRSKKIGYRITVVRLDRNHKPLSYETFADGWLQNEDAWGRPVDLEHLPDGSLLVSDDTNNAIYRIRYTGR